MGVPRIRYNIVRMLSGNVVFVLGQWGLVIAITKLAGAEALGIYARAHAITAPVFAFTNLGLNNSLATDIREKYKLPSYIILYTFVSIGAFILCLGGATVGGITGVTFSVLIALSIARIVENGSLLFYGVFERSEQIYLVSRSLALRGLFGFCLFFVLILNDENYLSLAVFGLAFSWLAVFLVHDLPKGTQLYRSSYKMRSFFTIRNVRDITPLFLTVLPLGALALTTSLTLNIPRYFIDYLSGARELGYFAAIIQLANAGAIIVNSVGKTITPRLAKYYISQPKAYVKLLIKAVFLASGVGVAGILFTVFFGKELLTMIYSKEVANNHLTLVFAMVWATILFMSTTLGCGMTAARSFRSQFIIGGSSLIVIMLASWILVKPYGITGAVFALIIAILVKLTGQLLMIRSLLTNKKGQLNREPSRVFVCEKYSR